LKFYIENKKNIDYDNCIEACFNYNIDYINKNKNIIQNLCINDEHFFSTLIDCKRFDIDECYDKYIDIINNNVFNSLKYMLENKILNPNIMITGSLMFFICIQQIDWFSEEIQKKYIYMVLKYTFYNIIRTFKDSKGKNIIKILKESELHDDEYSFFYDLFV
jgi:hypothetical protein